MASVVGAPVRLSTAFRDSSTPPVLVDPTTVTAYITLPDGTTTSGTATKDSTGLYHYDYTPALSGIFQYYFAGTGANAGIQLADVFTVLPTATGALISIADAKILLNKSLTVTTDDAEILAFIQSATRIINDQCGYTVPTTFTETVTATIDGRGRNVLILSKTPVLSVSAVSSTMISMPVIDISTLKINAESGVIYLGNWWSWFGPQSVTYIAGRSVVPPELQDACKLIVSYLWETQRGGAIAIPGTGGREASLYDEWPGFPTRALDLMRLSPSYAAPGLA